MKTPAWILRLLLGLLFLGLASHRSLEPVIWRYSARYLFFLAAFGVSAALLGWRIGELKWEAGSLMLALEKLRPLSQRLWPEERETTPVLLPIALHLTLLCVYLPPTSVWSSDPILETDYAHHFHQVELAVQAFSSGRSWTYDPSFCAGYPEGVLFDVDVKLAEVLAFLLTKMGVPVAVAYNLIIFLCFAAIPVLLLGFCRNFRIGPRVTLLILYTGVLLWHSQRMIVLFNSVGMFGFVFALYWTVYAMSVLHRCLPKISVSGFVQLALVLAVGLHAHILAPVLMLVPLASLYVLHFRSLSRTTHALLAAAVLTALAANAWWIRNVLMFWGDRVTTTFFPPKTLAALLEAVTGMKDSAPILGLLGLWGFLAYRRSDAFLALSGFASVAWFLALSYVLPGVPPFSHLEPARFENAYVVLSMIGTCLGIGVACKGLEMPRMKPVRIFPVVLVLFYFAMQFLSPRTVFENRFRSSRPAFAALNSWIQANTTNEGRIALMDKSPGYLTAAKVEYYNQRQLIGGPFSEMNLRHSHASFTSDQFLGVRLPDLTEAQVARFVDVYNIRWIITTTDEGAAVFKNFQPTIELVESFVLREGPRSSEPATDSPFARFARRSDEHPIAIFRVREGSSYFLKGSGRLAASRDRIEVSDASEGGIVVKYHWTDSLVTQPPLPLRSYPIEGSPVAFIEVQNGSQRDFTILAK